MTDPLNESIQTPEAPALPVPKQSIWAALKDAVRGTEADGVVGPDLTHVGSRVSLGAGILPNEPAALVRWIARTADVKPGVHMPAFGMLPQEDLRALAAYLKALQ